MSAAAAALLTQASLCLDVRSICFDIRVYLLGLRAGGRSRFHVVFPRAHLQVDVVAVVHLLSTNDGRTRSVDRAMSLT
jgi:hypothetical protein